MLTAHHGINRYVHLLSQHDILPIATRQERKTPPLSPKGRANSGVALPGGAAQAAVRSRPPPWRRISAASVSRAIASRSEEHTSELQSLMRISYAVFCLKTKMTTKTINHTSENTESKYWHSIN